MLPPLPFCGRRTGWAKVVLGNAHFALVTAYVRNQPVGSQVQWKVQESWLVVEAGTGKQIQSQGQGWSQEPVAIPGVSAGAKSQAKGQSQDWKPVATPRVRTGVKNQSQGEEAVARSNLR